MSKITDASEFPLTPHALLTRLQTIPPSTLILFFFSALFFYNVLLVIYRLTLHPLARFPGPKLAAAAWWYELYYDVIQPGLYWVQVEAMHKKYGPVVRISPHELHLNHKDLWEPIFNAKNDKWKWGIDAIGLPDSTVGTVPHTLHRKRRAALSTFFSRRSVERFGHVVYDSLERLFERMQKAQITRANADLASFSLEDESCAGVLDMGSLWHQLAVDIVTEYAFARSYGLVADCNRGDQWVHMLRVILAGAQARKHLPILVKIQGIMSLLPISWVKRLAGEAIAEALRLQNDMRMQIIAIKEGDPNIKYKAHPTIFHDLIENHAVPLSEKKTDRLWQDGQSVIVGGSETVAKVMTHITFHLLDKPEILERLRRELEEGGFMTKKMQEHEEIPRWQDLEKSSYLSAVVMEGLRVSMPAVQRMNRVLPNEWRIFTVPDASNPDEFGNPTLREYRIPPGIPVSMSQHLLHRDESIFPRPMEFIPERWLDTDSPVTSTWKDGTKGRKNLLKYIATFGYGTRICVGMNLAYAELHGLVGHVFGPNPCHKLQLKLYNTKAEDVNFVHDHVVGAPRLGTTGCRAIVERYTANSTIVAEGLEANPLKDGK